VNSRGDGSGALFDGQAVRLMEEDLSSITELGEGGAMNLTNFCSPASTPRRFYFCFLS
jgi:hypothetical protein